MKKSYIIFTILILASLAVYAGTTQLQPKTGQNPSSAITNGEETIRNISAEEAKQILENDKDVIVLDVRTPEEFSNGHIKNAINIDFYAPEFKGNIAKLSPDKTYILHCRSGARSSKALNTLKDAGISNILHMNHGFNEWREKNLPISKL